MTFYEEAKPVYTCYHYRNDFYKIVKFKRSLYDGFPSVVKDEPTVNEKVGERFLASLSRSRSLVLQYALANEWDFFFTGTLDERKQNRFDIGSYVNRLSQFIRDCRKKYDADIKYLLVPERHQDGAWHVHGLLSGIPLAFLAAFIRGVHPDRLVDGDYLNWPDYQAKFGYCSLGHVKDPVKVAFYVSKYITKELAENVRGVGRHMYFASRGLKKAVKDGSAYAQSSALDKCVSRDYDFCEVGYCKLPWDFVVDHFDPDDPEEQGRGEAVENPAADPRQYFEMVEYDLDQLDFFDL